MHQFTSHEVAIRKKLDLTRQTGSTSYYDALRGIRSLDKLWLDLPVTSSILNAYKYSHDYIMKYSGLNIGNFVFRKAVFSLVEDASHFTPCTWSEGNKLINAEDSSTIISCANWLGMGEKNEASNLNRAQIIEAMTGNFLILGLGAQASHGQDLDLGENTKRLARALASKVNLLSVRDLTTANALEQIGIDNAVVTGCPSNFINLDLKTTDFDSSYINKNATWADINFLISEASGGNPLSISVTSRIYSILAQSQGSSYVLQSPALLPFLYREVDELPRFYELASNSNTQSIAKLMKAKSKVFTSVDEWLFSSRFYDISFGMRIHGTMVPLQAGVPSVLIAHDQRTAGLADTMGIPKLTCKEFVDQECIQKPENLLEIFRSNLIGYMDRRQELAQEFLKVITSNGFTPSSSFCRYCD